jgi:hypothetical protein
MRKKSTKVRTSRAKLRNSRAAVPTPSPTNILSMQKDLLETYDQMSHAWISRVRSELDLWSELATKLAGMPSVPSAMEACQECVTKRMKLAAVDRKHLLVDSNKFIRTLTRSVSNGLPVRSH